MRWFTSAVAFIVILSFYAVLHGCASTPTTHYIHPNADFAAIGRVAVLPFSNFTRDQFAGQKIHDLFVIELLSEGVVEVAESGEVFKALSEGGVAEVEKMNKETIQKVGQQLDVQALITGTVQEFQVERSGATPSASVVLSFKMIEVDSGVVIWTVSVSHEGSGLASKLFGASTAKKGKVARDLVRKALRTLIQ